LPVFNNLLSFQWSSRDDIAEWRFLFEKLFNDSKSSFYFILFLTRDVEAEAEAGSGSGESG